MNWRIHIFLIVIASIILIYSFNEKPEVIDSPVRVGDQVKIPMSDGTFEDMSRT